MAAALSFTSMRLLFRSLALLVAFLALTGVYALAQDDAATPVKTDFDTMQAVEDAWSSALVKHDQFALEGVLSAAYVDISADGEVTTRNQQIARLFLKDTDTLSFEQKVASVRLLGDIAVVNGTYVLRYTRAGKTVEDKGIFSHVFQRVRTRWQCINSQRTFVVEQAGDPKKGTTRQSDLPFHLPHLRSGDANKAPPPANQPAAKTPPAIPGPQ